MKKTPTKLPNFDAIDSESSALSWLRASVALNVPPTRGEAMVLLMWDRSGDIHRILEDAREGRWKNRPPTGEILL